MSSTALGLRILAGVALFLAAMVLLFSRTDETADRVKVNRERITLNRDRLARQAEGTRAACDLVRELLLRAGAPDPTRPNALPNDAAQLAAHRRAVLTRLMTPAEREVERRLVRRIMESRGELEAPDCDRITAGP